MTLRTSSRARLLWASLWTSVWTVTFCGALATLGMLLVGCGGDSSSPTEPASTAVVLASAVVTIDGDPVDGRTVPRGHGSSTRFEARLHNPDGTPAADCQVRVVTDRPGHGPGHRGTLHLYDDGTHGDHVPGDGLYCYEDPEGEYGCHGADAPLGEHHWEFAGWDHHGNESNHRTVTVTVVEP